MNVYLAGSWLRKDELSAYRDIIERADSRITVVSQWLNGADGPHSAFGVQGRDYFERECMRDAADVDRCDVFVLFANEPTKPTIGGGRHWENGYAYAKQKTCIVVGEQENIFYYMPGMFHVDSFSTLIPVLSGLATALENQCPDTRPYSYIQQRLDATEEAVSCSG
jgi:nucleoside 2-deoxyribosyltransferase